MLDLPILSVVVVAYKSAGEIEACLASLPRAIDGRNVECIVVDNSPGDGTGAVVRSKFPQAGYIELSHNPGFGAANNAGLRSSSGEFVLFLNPDTISNRVALETCLRRLKADDRIGMISPKLVLKDGSMDMACRRSIPTLWDGFCRASGLAAWFPRSAIFGGYNLTHLPEGGTYEVGAVNGAFMLMPRRVLGEIGGFDEAFFMYGDDLDLCIRVARAGYRIVYDGSVSIIHLKGVSVAKDYDRMAKAIFDANRDVYLKHFNPSNSLLVRWKYFAAFGAWKRISGLKARLSGYRRVRPL